METPHSLFENGSLWLKADFHLHTKADKEFQYDGEANKFCRSYVKQLQKQDIGIGVITNHNKFDKDEFKALRRAANKENIWLLPGVELSLKEGIHLLIVFEDQWYKGQNDHINQFLTSAFLGVDNYDTPPYRNSNCDMQKTIDKLDQVGLDYFFVMAHADDNNGLFKVLKSRTLEKFSSDNSFNRVLALQKSRNKQNYDLLCKNINRNIAYVEGSDNAQKGIEGVGSGRTTFIKIGDHNFEALKYALTDTEYRISPQNKPEVTNSYIKSISFEGGLLEQTKIDFSPELNSFIGIRGSGKSSILEILRYSLDVFLGEQASDRNYKNDLIEHVLKSGGKIITTVVNKQKIEYRIEKIYEHEVDIYEGAERQDVSSIDTIFKKPVYFGQKDLSNKHIDFEADLVKKLIGDRLDDVQEEIKNKSSEVRNIISRLKELDDLTEEKKEIEAKIKDAQHKLKLFKDKGIANKLKRQSVFDTDIAHFENVNTSVVEFQDELSHLYESYEDFFSELQFVSQENKDIFEQASQILNDIRKEFTKLNKIYGNITKEQEKFGSLHKKLLKKKENLKEKFAKIKREINIPDLNPDDFLKFKRIMKTSQLQFAEIKKSQKEKENLQRSLNDCLAELNDLWHKEFKIVEKEVKRINDYEKSLSIEVIYKGRRDKFREEIEQLCKGSGIRKNTYETMTKKYKDFVHIHKDFANLDETLNLNESQTVEFKKRFNKRLEDLLTYRVADKFTIQYNQKPLSKHSLGQRATALILFLLAQKETNVLIIDQPEDDLDNQTIYEDVLKSIKKLKGNMQFIFATHNPNIPVLGDSEKIISCEYVSSDASSEIKTIQGTIDSPDIQTKIITIMEGGKEAFLRRKTIYENWNK